MSRELGRRLAKLERHDEDATVRQISDLIDELSAKAAGGDGSPQQVDGLLNMLEGDE